MIFAEEPIVRYEGVNGIETVKISKNALRVYRNDQLYRTMPIRRFNAGGLRDFILLNRNIGMITMLLSESQATLITQLVNELYGWPGVVVQPNAAFSPEWLYAKYVYHWLSKYYEGDVTPKGVPCYTPDAEDDYSDDPASPLETLPTLRLLQDRADAPKGQFYYLTWEGDEMCRLLMTKDLLCNKKPEVVGEIPIFDITEEFIVRFLKSERRKALRQVLANPNEDDWELFCYFHNLLIPFIFYTQNENLPLDDVRLDDVLLNNLYYI